MTRMRCGGRPPPPRCAATGTDARKEGRTGRPATGTGAQRAQSGGGGRRHESASALSAALPGGGSSEESTPCTPQVSVQAAVFGWRLNGSNSHHRPVQVHGPRHESAGPFGIRSANKRLVRTHTRAKHSNGDGVDLIAPLWCVLVRPRSPCCGLGAFFFFGLRAAAPGAAFTHTLHAVAFEASSTTNDGTYGPYSGRPTATEAGTDVEKRQCYPHDLSTARSEKNPGRQENRWQTEASKWVRHTLRDPLSTRRRTPICGQTNRGNGGTTGGKVRRPTMYKSTHARCTLQLQGTEVGACAALTSVDFLHDDAARRTAG